MTDICVRLLLRVAERRGVPVDELAPLYETIDPDALEALVSRTSSSSNRNLTVRFTYHGYTVTIDSEGLIDLAEPTL